MNRDLPPGQNRYLADDFRPLQEEITAEGLPVSGTLPKELNGRFLRNGPNPIAANPGNYHLFLGDGMVHGVRLHNGKAEWYRNRWVRQAAVNRMLGEPPRKELVVGGIDVPVNTNIVQHAGKTLALVESGTLPYELSYELDTIGSHDFEGTLNGAFSGHPKFDPKTGEMHSVNYLPGVPFVQYCAVSPEGRVNRTVNVPIPSNPMMHDFALTENYIILFDLPAVFSPRAAMQGEVIPYLWDENKVSRFGLLPRGGMENDIRWVEIPATWIYHTLNAYEVDNRIILYVVTHPRMFKNRIGSVEGHGAPVLDRYVIDIETGTAEHENLDPRPQEFPRINEGFTGLYNRYGYTLSTVDLVRSFALNPEKLSEQDLGNNLMKYDFQTGEKQTHYFKGRSLSEPTFVEAAVHKGKMTAISCYSNTTPDAARATCASFPPGTLPPHLWHEYICRPVCRSGFTATGRPTSNKCPCPHRRLRFYKGLSFETQRRSAPTPKDALCDGRGIAAMWT